MSGAFVLYRWWCGSFRRRGESGEDGGDAESRRLLEMGVLQSSSTQEFLQHGSTSATPAPAGKESLPDNHLPRGVQDWAATGSGVNGVAERSRPAATADAASGNSAASEAQSSGSRSSRVQGAPQGGGGGNADDFWGDREGGTDAGTDVRAAAKTQAYASDLPVRWPQEGGQ